MKAGKKMRNLFGFIFQCLFWMGLITIFVFALSSCGCNYHLRKAKQKCGYTSKTDTVIIFKPIKIAGQSKDTSFVANKDYKRLSFVLDSIFLKLDSLGDNNSILQNKNETLLYLLDINKRNLLKQVIIGAAKKNNCIKDTLTIFLENNGTVKLWQTKEGEIKFKLREPDREISVKVPVAINTQVFKESFMYGMKWILACLLILLAILILVRFFPLRK